MSAFLGYSRASVNLYQLVASGSQSDFDRVLQSVESVQFLNAVEKLLISIRFPDQVNAGLIHCYRVGGGKDADVVDIRFLGVWVAVTVDRDPVHDVDVDNSVLQIIRNPLGRFGHALKKLHM